MQSIPLTFERDTWQVAEDYRIRVLGVDILVPKGFKTNLASTPRILWAIFPPFGKYNTAAVVHDYLYAQGKVDRFVCDAIFYDIMKLSGVNIITRTAFYTAVRIAGFIFYVHTRRKTDYRRGAVKRKRASKNRT